MGTAKHLHWMKMAVAASLLIVASGQVTDCLAAEKYPTRPIQVVIGFEPGSTDTAVKVFTDRLAEVLGQPISFVYKPGAAGSIGAMSVVKSKPDGYTLLAGAPAPFITPPLTLKGADYSLDSFTPICRICSQATAIVVKADARWNTLKEFIDEARKSAGKLNYSTSGVYGTNHIPMEVLQRQAGFTITHIPTTGSGASMTAILGGHVDLVVSPMSAVTPHLKSGALRALAFIYRQRVPDFPNVPTLVDLGYPITYSGWFGIAGPKGMATDVVQTLYNACDRVMDVHKKAVEEQLRKLSQDPAYIRGADFMRELRTDWDITKKIVDELEKSKSKK